MNRSTQAKNKRLIALLFCTVLGVSSVLANEKDPVSLKNQPTQALQRIVVPGSHYEVGMGLGEMAPNATKGRRTQSGPEMVYVLQGELILILDGQPEKIIKKGQSFQIQANVLHETKAGPSGAKFLATWVVEESKRNQFVVPAQENKPDSAQKKLAELETTSGGRLGIYAINTANNTYIKYRPEELFPFCSTAKVMVVSAILKRSEKNPSLLQEKITYTQNDVDKSEYAPITKQHVDSGMSVIELCQAALDYSDNTAMNLLLKVVGGTKAVTSYARSIHDNKFRLDRWEPDLNTAIPGDTRDTTTPAMMAASLQRLTLGNLLASPQREQLQVWMKNNTTGNTKIRAGVPQGWIVGDKTGNGQYGTTNDIGIIWPPKCPPIVIAIYLTQNKKDAVKREDIIASATRIVLNEFANTDQCVKQNYS